MAKRADASVKVDLSVLKATNIPDDGATLAQRADG